MALLYLGLFEFIAQIISRLPIFSLFGSLVRLGCDSFRFESAPWISLQQWFLVGNLGHLALRVLRARPGPLDRTLAATAYVMGSLGPLTAVSISGIPLFTLATLPHLTLALAHVHRCPAWKAAAAVLLASAVCLTVSGYSPLFCWLRYR